MVSGCDSNQGIAAEESSAVLVPDESFASQPPPFALAVPGAETLDFSDRETYRVCAECHEDHYLLWENGGHSPVGCNICHGTSHAHVLGPEESRPKLRLRGDARLCLSCHGPSERMLKDIPKIESFEAHVKFVGEKHSVSTDLEKTKGQCIFCHEPHSLE
jgi:hypothetical protein